MKVKLSFDAQSNPESLIVTVECLDPTFVGHEATLTISAEATVKDSRPVHGQKKLVVEKFRMGASSRNISIPRAKLPVYAYRGTQIDIDVKAELRIDDGIVFDTKVKQELALEGPVRRGSAECAKHLVEPKDLFKFWANWRAIPASNKMIALALAIAAAIVGLVNSAIGYHDQFAPEGKTYFYSHRDSDGDSESPLVNSSAITGGVAVALWLALRRQLRTYMTFRTGKQPLNRIGRHTQAVVGNLFYGRSRVPLNNIVLRIVACNMEKGQYTRGSGSNTRTVSFAEPVRGVVLFQKRVSVIPAGAAVEDFFPESVAFAPIFELLLPPNQVTDSHGLEVHWEIQLLHDQYVDQELVGPVTGLVREDFYDTPSSPMVFDAPLPAEFR